VKASKTEQEPQWQKTPIANLVRNAASNMYYGRLRVSDKLIWKSLKTDRMSAAKMRLVDFLKDLCQADTQAEKTSFDMRTTSSSPVRPRKSWKMRSSHWSSNLCATVVCNSRQRKLASRTIEQGFDMRPPEVLPRHGLVSTRDEFRDDVTTVCISSRICHKPRKTLNFRGNDYPHAR
jgi:hypothetical protein